MRQRELLNIFWFFLIQNDFVKLEMSVFRVGLSKVNHNCICALKTCIRQDWSESSICLLTGVCPSHKLPLAIGCCNVVLYLFGVSVRFIIWCFYRNSTKWNLLFKDDFNPTFTFYAVYSTPFAPWCIWRRNQINWVLFTCATALNRELALHIRLILF